MNWKLLWNGTRETWSTAGEFDKRADAERARSQLAKLKPQAEFKIEFIGRQMGHHNGHSIREKF